MDKDETTKIHDDAKKRLGDAWEYDRINREEALKDLRFLALDQWPEHIRNDREAEDRPCLTLDRLNQHKNQVVNDIRQSDITIKAIPGDDQADEDVADIYTSLMRDIQYQNHADYVYAGAADGAVSCGIGHFRFTTDYVKDRVFEQEIGVELIPYHLAVYWDPSAVKPDRSDAEWLHVTEYMTQESFKETYPDAAPVDVPVQKPESDSGLYWANSDGVLISEYWSKQPEKKQLVAFESGAVLDVTGMEDEQIMFLIEQYGQPIGDREADGYAIEQTVISGAETLTETQRWAGQYFPIIPIIGNEIHLEDKVVRTSLIRGARDPQQLYNYWRTAAAEMIALAPKSKIMATEANIGPYSEEWKKANTSNLPYLPFRIDPKAPSFTPSRVPAPDTPSAMWQEAALVGDDIKAAMGQYDASLGARSNESSGRAIMARQREGDVSTFHFSDNMQRSLEHAGRVLIDLIPTIYDTQRTIRIIGEDDAQKFEKVNWPTIPEIDPETGGMKTNVLHDLSRGRYDVRVKIGPSYTSKREESREAMISWIQADPGSIPIARDLIVKTLDFEKADEMAERFRKTMPPEFLNDDERPQMTPEEQQQKQQMQQLEQESLMLKKANAEAEVKGKETKIEEMMVGIQKTLSEIQKIQAETAETVADTQKTEVETATQSQPSWDYMP